jgi:hypothetical protein
MEGFLKQNTATNVTVLIVASSDHIAGLTGLAAGLTIYASKAGGTPAAITPTVTELSSSNTPGQYKLALTTSHVDTLGELQLHITGSGADPADYKWQVVAVDLADATRLGLAALPNANAGANGGLPTGDGSGRVTVITNSDKAGYSLTTTPATAADVLAQVAAALNTAIPGSPTADSINERIKTLDDAYTAARGALLDRLDAAVTTRASATDYTTARATKLDNLDTNVGSRSTYAGGPVASVAAPVALAGLDSPVLQSGTAQAGTLGTITLASGASATDNIYRGALVKIYSGTGVGQVREINSYTGSTRQASVGRDWATVPDATSQYAVLAFVAPKVDDSLRVEASSVQGDVTGKVIGGGSGVLGGVGVQAQDVASVRLVTDHLATALELNASLYRFTTAALANAPAAASVDLTAVIADLDTLLTRLSSARALLLDKLDTMLEADGSNYKFTQDALSEAPVGVIGLAAGGSRLFGSASGGTAYPGQSINLHTVVYNEGDTVRFSVTFKDDAGTAADPTSVVFKLKAGTVVTSYSSRPPIVRDSVGNYHIDLLLNASGVVTWRWEGDGAVAAGTEGKIGIRDSTM